MLWKELRIERAIHWKKLHMERDNITYKEKLYKQIAKECISKQIILKTHAQIV